jgi:hypothetical protein
MCALVRDRPLVPVATLHTRRLERQLLDAKRNVPAIVADDLVTADRLTDGPVEILAQRGVEVDLVNEERAILEAVSGNCARWD